MKWNQTDLLDGGHALLPVLRLHGDRDLGVVVEDAGDDGELDLDEHGIPQLLLLRDLRKGMHMISAFIFGLSTLPSSEET